VLVPVLGNPAPITFNDIMNGFGFIICYRFLMAFLFLLVQGVEQI
jgi:hypothetical protein